MHMPALIGRFRSRPGPELQMQPAPPAPSPPPGPPPPSPALILEGYEFFNNRGVLLPIVPAVFSDEIARAVRSGQYEESEAAELDGLIQPGEVILEIGAGCGFMSTYCAKNRDVVSVNCVEANPQMIDVIRLTHRVNQVGVTVLNEVLGKQDGTADFYVHPSFWASGTYSWLGQQIRVPATSFQRRLDEVRPTMLIIDIEGGEETLFEDVDLTGIKKIMVELHQPTIKRQGVKKVFDLLSAQAFHYDVWHSSRSVVTFSHIDRI